MVLFADATQVFVGRGARRVRTLFEDAARRAPCVLFIDELDALGAARNRAGSGGSDEHDHTLNQLLAMMDGIGSSSGVLVMGATNRLAALDPALTRPGRFDRVLQLKLPNEAGRLAILQVHAARTPCEASRVVLPRVAAATEGFSGAELANLVNEAAIGAARVGDSHIRASHFDAALHTFRLTRETRPSSGVGLSTEQQLRACAALLQGAFTSASEPASSSVEDLE